MSTARCVLFPKGRPELVVLLSALVALAGCSADGRRSGSEAAPPPAEAARNVSDSAAGPIPVGAGAEGSRDTVSMPSGQVEETLSSGIEGIVTIGPACPVIEAGQECPDRPYRARLVVRNAESGRLVASVDSDEDGRFRIELPPGRYIVDPGEPQVLTEPRAQPDTVVVEPSGFVEARIRFDSGVR